MAGISRQRTYKSVRQMRKFSIGDKVRIVPDTCNSYYGALGIVIAYSLTTNCNIYTVRFLPYDGVYQLSVKFSEKELIRFCK